VRATVEPAELHSARVAVDAQGNALVGGTFQGTLRLGGVTLESAGGKDVFVAMLSPSGAVLWSQRFGDAQDQHLAALAVDPAGNALVTGNFSGAMPIGGATLSAANLAIFVAKLDRSGNAVWSKAIEGEDSIQTAAAIAADRAGNVLLAGNLEGTVDLGGMTLSHGGVNPFVVKFDPEGSPIWTKSFGCSVDQWITAIDVDPSGAVLVAGNAKYTCVDGVTYGTGLGFQNILLAAIEPDGALRWAQIIGNRSDPYDSALTDMAVDRSGAMVVTVHLPGPVDFGGLAVEAPLGDTTWYAVTIDRQGRGRWATQLGFDATAVAMMPSGDALVVGRAWEEVSGVLEADLALARLGSGGALRWMYRASLPGDQHAIDVATQGRNRALVLGAGEDSLGLGCEPAAGGGGPAVFLTAAEVGDRCAE